jgi:hypothetical protein
MLNSNMDSIKRFALEKIHKNDIIFLCDQNVGCDYVRMAIVFNWFTREQLLDLRSKNDKLKEFILRYASMIDDDRYLIPIDWDKLKVESMCAFINHSCDGCLGFTEVKDETCPSYIARRDIEPGELSFCFQSISYQTSKFFCILFYSM